MTKHLLILAFLTLNALLIRGQETERQFCSNRDFSNSEETSEETFCPLVLRNVIGFDSQDLHSVFGNECEACRDEQTVYYYNLEYCPSDSSQTQCYDGEVCVVVNDKVTTVESGCAACQQYGPGTLFFRDVCPLSKETIGFCTEEKRNRSCTGSCTETEEGGETCVDVFYSLVCATFDSGKQVYVDECNACKQGAVSYVYAPCEETKFAKGAKVCTEADRQTSCVGGSCYFDGESGESICEEVQYPTVCATTSNGERRTILDACAVCADDNVVSYTEGVCPIDSHICTEDERTADCSLEETILVCALSRDGTTRTSDRCGACLDRSVVSYYTGSCEGPDVIVGELGGEQGGEQGGETATETEAEQGGVAIPLTPQPYHFCHPDERDVACPFTFAPEPPVCAYYSNGAQITINGACFACSNPLVQSYSEGACDVEIFVCTEEDRSRECFDSNSEVGNNFEVGGNREENFPNVCATLSDGSQKSMRECEVCRDQDVVSYVNGACPFDDTSARTYCQPDSRNAQCTDDCTQDENGNTVCRAGDGVVCATTFDYTYQTYINECYACRNSSVVSYVSGGCRDNLEPLRVSYCRNFIECSSGEEAVSEMMFEALPQVCGISPNRKQEYSSYCAACRAGAIAFTQGPCE